MIVWTHTFQAASRLAAAAVVKALPACGWAYTRRRAEVAPGGSRRMESRHSVCCWLMRLLTSMVVRSHQPLPPQPLKVV